MIWKHLPILVLDTETTGLNSSENRIIEVAWVSYLSGTIRGEGSFLIDPELTEIPAHITELTGIRIEDLQGQPKFRDLVPFFHDVLLEHPILAGYNAIGFDKHFLVAELIRSASISTIPYFLSKPWLDPLIWVRHFQKYEKGKRLTQAAERLGIKVEGAHRALNDSRTTMAIMNYYINRLPDNLSDVLDLQSKWDQEHSSNYSEWRSKREEI